MNQQNIQLFLISNQKKFNAEQIPQITERLKKMSDNDLTVISSADYKDPTFILILSLFFGALGVDRFILGEIGIGVLKLLTGGCLGVLTIIDWITIMDRTKQKKYETFCNAVNVSSLASNNSDYVEPLVDSNNLLKECVIVAGEEKKIKIGSLPNGLQNSDLVFKSNDESIAKVNDYGIITGVSVGITTIDIKTKSGAYSAHILTNVVDE